MAGSPARLCRWALRGSFVVLAGLLAAPAGAGGFAGADSAAAPVITPVQYRPIPEPMPMPMPTPRPRPMPPIIDPIGPQQYPGPIRPIQGDPGSGQGVSSGNPQGEPAADLDSVADSLFSQDIASLPIVVKARGATG